MTIRLGEVERGDLDRVASFLAAMFHDADAAGWLVRLRDWWENNPFQPPGVPRGLMHTLSGGEVVGFLGNIPVEYRLRGRSVVAGVVTSLAVDPRFRKAELARELTETLTAHAGVELFLGSGATPPSLRRFRDAGWRELDRPWQRSRLLLPASAAPLLAALLDRRGLPRAVRAAARRLADWAGGEGFAPPAANWQRAPSGYRIEMPARFDPAERRRLQAFAAGVPMQRVLSPEFLDWFYFGGDRGPKRAVLALRRGKELAGYVGLRLIRKRGLRTVECVELRAGEVAEAKLLLSAARRLARASGAAYLAIRPADRLERQASRALRGFRSTKPFVYIWKTRAADLDPSDWVPRPYDADEGFL